MHALNSIYIFFALNTYDNNNCVSICYIYNIIFLRLYSIQWCWSWESQSSIYINKVTLPSNIFFHSSLLSLQSLGIVLFLLCWKQFSEFNHSVVYPEMTKQNLFIRLNVHYFTVLTRSATSLVKICTTRPWRNHPCISQKQALVFFSSISSVRFIWPSATYWLLQCVVESSTH